MASTARRRARAAATAGFLLAFVGTGLAAFQASAAPLATAVAPEYADAPRWQLSIVVDARDFISASDYAAELEAVASGLDDQTAIPRDGRFAISVTSLGNDPDQLGMEAQARLVVSATVIDSDATVDHIQDVIRSIPQAATHADEEDADAFNYAGAFGSMSVYPVEDDEWLDSVCQVSFSQPSDRLIEMANLNTAGGGTDRFDLIGVGGYGNTGSTAREGDMGTYDLAGTGYTYVASASAIAGSWVSACTTRLPMVIGMEVTQSVQSLWNHIPLVTGKTTVVRVFAESVFGEAGEPHPTLYGTLTASRAPDGDSLSPDPLDPVRKYMAVTLTANAQYVRDNPDGRYVLEFKLPEEWTQTGNLYLNLNLPPGTTCAWFPGALTERYCQGAVRFDPVPVPKVWAYQVSYDGNKPTLDEIDEQMLRLKSQWPVNDVEYGEIRVLHVKGNTPSPDSVDLALWMERNLYGPAPGYTTTIYYGFVDDSRFRGQSYIGQLVGASSITSRSGQGESVEGGTGQWRNSFVHESGHAIGLHHVLALPITDLHPSLFSWPGSTRWRGACGAELMIVEPQQHDSWWYYQRDFRFVDGAVVEVRAPITSWYRGGRSIDSTGDVIYTPQRDEDWGIDTRYVGTTSLLTYADPRLTGELMSYVNGSGCKLVDEVDRSNRDPLVRQGRWSTPDTYLEVMWDLRDHIPLPLSGLEQLRKLIVGDVAADGTVSFGPVLEIRRPAAGYSNDLGFVLNLYDASDNLLGTAIPEMGFLANDVGLEGDETSAGGAAFAAEIEYEGVARVELALNGDVLGSNAASAHEPSVTITSPASGVALAGDTIRVEWAGDDADGDALEYDVVYTTDGRNWVTLSRGQTEQSLTFDRSEISGSASGLIRVVVNDGFSSAYDEVSGLAVAGLPPTLRITSPLDGAKLGAELPLVLDAYAFDPEDGTLADPDVTWVSNVDGPIDTSGAEYLRGEDLSLGFHTLTASVTDSDGNTTHASATIEILGVDPGGSTPPVGGGTTATASGRSSTSAPTLGPSSSPTASPSAFPSASPSVTPSVDDSVPPAPVEASGATDKGGSSSWAYLWIVLALFGGGVLAWRLWARAEVK